MNIEAQAAPISSEASSTSESLDVERLRQDFPGLHQQVHGHPLVYLDNSATTQVPRVVVDAISHFHLHDRANIHRGVHTLSQRATRAYDGVRETVRSFLNAAHEKEIIFVRGTSEAINLVAHSHGRQALQPGDEVIVSQMEHHSNIVPWQLVCEATGAVLKVIPFNDRGELDMNAYRQLLGPRTRMVSVVHVSNALGTINPVRDIVRLAHDVGALVLLDGAQAVAHTRVDVQELGCDFYAFSGHKLFGPTGVGVLFGRAELLDAMSPYQGGGDMIDTVSFEGTTFAELPNKFEAGTPHIAGVIGLGAAIEYVNGIGIERIEAYEQELLEYATAQLQTVPGLRLVGTAAHKASVCSFLMDCAHPQDIGTLLDQVGVAVRTGHHCAQPVMDRLGIPATARASLAFYNTNQEIDALVAGLHQVRDIFGEV
ncbi:MAG: cysteine desulfurase [Myxococcota bacterium]|jgi:cysteine desulfurase/selenocysteine lyase|nr:cysteine desulfurase [Myxococcota bacterium]